MDWERHTPFGPFLLRQLVDDRPGTELGLNKSLLFSGILRHHPIRVGIENATLQGGQGNEQADSTPMRSTSDKLPPTHRPVWEGNTYCSISHSGQLKSFFSIFPTMRLVASWENRIVVGAQNHPTFQPPSTTHQSGNRLWRLKLRRASTSLVPDRKRSRTPGA